MTIIGLTAEIEPHTQRTHPSEMNQNDHYAAMSKLCQTELDTSNTASRGNHITAES